ncbi:MAG: DNA-processing protein DprA [Lentisphaeria bacterium]|nr:DNA-processing protein DprA [Lentisphaeria bacterium]
MTDREAYIILNLISGIGPARLNALLEFCGAPAEIFQTNVRDLASVQGIGESLARRIADWEKQIDLEHELDLAKRGGVEIITRGEENYPELLSKIHDPPICLYVRGRIPDNISTRSLAIVGTRNVTSYGQRMARHLAEAAAYSSFTVVSGLAYGVDAIAHRAALDAGGESVSVLGGGLARIQPQEHVPLAREIAQHGAVISEFPMEFSPTRHSFPMRNRIISGLCRATLVVEAGLNSGSLITASFALEQGRTVFAVPGQADNPQAAGCNRLIRQNAILTETFDDILEEFDFLPGFGHQENLLREDRAAEEFLSDGGEDPSISSEAARILDFLSKGDAAVDEISAGLDLSAGEITAALIGLELLRRVRKDGLKYHRVR